MKVVVSGSEDGCVYVWSLENGDLLQVNINFHFVFARYKNKKQRDWKDIEELFMVRN